MIIARAEHRARPDQPRCIVIVSDNRPTSTAAVPWHGRFGPTFLLLFCSVWAALSGSSSTPAAEAPHGPFEPALATPPTFTRTAATPGTDRAIVAIVEETYEPAGEDFSQVTPASGVVVAATAHAAFILTLAEAIPHFDAQRSLADLQATAIQVVLPGGALRPASILAIGDDSSGVLIRAETQLEDELEAVRLGSSQHLGIGDAVWTAGNSFGAVERDALPIYSRGVISGRYIIPEGSPPVRGKRGHILSAYRGPVLETDAAVNDGNHGGALIDQAGRLVGLVSLGVAHQRKVGTAVPLQVILKDLATPIQQQVEPALGTLHVEDQPAAKDPVAAALAHGAAAIADSIVSCYVKRPNGPGNPGQISRPAPITDSIPRYQRARLEEQWQRWHHAQQVAFTDQAIPAMIVDAESGILLTAASNLHGDATNGVAIGIGPDGTTARWQVLSTHAELDLALLQCDGPITGTTLTLAEEPALRTGDPVAIVGRHRDGGSHTMTAGIISATERRHRASEFAFHQTDALANYGNLGGPVVDIAGQVVGMVVHLGPHLQWGINSGVGMFVDSQSIRAVLPDLLNGLSVEHMRAVGLGFRPVLTEPEHGDAGNTGIEVESVLSDTGAAAAGMQPGDRIIQVNTYTIEEPEDLRRALIRPRLGDVVAVTVIRGEQQVELQITLGILPEADTDDDVTAPEQGSDNLSDQLNDVLEKMFTPPAEAPADADE